MAHALCMLDNLGYTHTHTHTHSEYVMLIAFPLQQWRHERASILRYMYIACLVNMCDCLVPFITFVCCMLPRMVVICEWRTGERRESVAARFNISDTVVTVCSPCFNIHKLCMLLTRHIYIYTYTYIYIYLYLHTYTHTHTHTHTHEGVLISP